MSRFGVVATIGVILAVAVSLPVSAGARHGAGGHRGDSRVRFYVPPPDRGAIVQIARLRAKGAKRDAALIKGMINTPSAVWFNGGTPREVRKAVRETVKRAEAKKTVPVLVAYNIPFRDCSQFSAGGTTSTDEYLAWIDGFAKGIGKSKVVVILEPDGLGIIPWYDPFGDRDGSSALEWCQPAEADPATAATDRFFQLSSAVDRIEQQPRAAVYLDGTHSSWLGSGDAADRLVKANVLGATGFFSNVSNYQEDQRLIKHATWISQCIAFGNNAEEGGWRLGHYEWCASQYFPANPADFSTWHLSDEWYAANLGTATPTAHFVIDSSRNGRGPWVPPADHPAGDPQDWCNPPDRGTGVRPTARTRTPLFDAWLWVKIPGESDGQCNRWAPLGSPDPVRGIVDPPAGDWFPEMALELARNAEP
jgi:endoglucanase